MKRSGFKNKGSQLKRSGFKPKTKSSFKTLYRPMRKVSVSSGAKEAAELWKWFSLFVKLRDNWVCITCGHKEKGKRMHAGHFIRDSVGGLALRYNEVNVHAQCENCNLFLEGNEVVYREKMLALYGQEIVASIGAQQYDITFDYPFKEKIEHYKKMVNTMELSQVFPSVRDLG